MPAILELRELRQDAVDGHEIVPGAVIRRHVGRRGRCEQKGRAEHDPSRKGERKHGPEKMAPG